MSASLSRALRKSTGTAESARRRRQISKPDSSGRTTSNSTRSGRARSSCSFVSRPFAACRTRKPSASRKSRISSAICTSSSTTRIDIRVSSSPLTRPSLTEPRPTEGSAQSLSSNCHRRVPAAVIRASDHRDREPVRRVPPKPGIPCHGTHIRVTRSRPCSAGHRAASAAPAAFEGRDCFAALVAHELRAPIALQRALVEVTLADPDADVAALRKMGEHVLASCIQQQRLIELLLDLACSGGALARQEPVDLATIAAAALRAHDPSGLEIVVTLKPAQTSGDPDLLLQLATNLVANATRHNIAGGTNRARNPRTRRARCALDHQHRPADRGRRASAAHPETLPTTRRQPHAAPQWTRPGARHRRCDRHRTRRPTQRTGTNERRTFSRSLIPHVQTAPEPR